MNITLTRGPGAQQLSPYKMSDELRPLAQRFGGMMFRRFAEAEITAIYLNQVYNPRVGKGDSLSLWCSLGMLRVIRPELDMFVPDSRAAIRSSVEQLYKRELIRQVIRPEVGEGLSHPDGLLLYQIVDYGLLKVKLVDKRRYFVHDGVNIVATYGCSLDEASLSIHLI